MNKVTFLLFSSVWFFVIVPCSMAKDARMFEPVEWEFVNPSWEGNPFDIAAEAVFSLDNGNQQITTGLFYAGGKKWKLRFTGTKAGTWRFVTNSVDEQLNGLKGEVRVKANPGKDGFVSNVGSKWIRTGTNRAFSPQYVMYPTPDVFYDNAQRIDADIEEFIVGHGFNGFNIWVACRWFDFEKTRSNEIASDDPDPDPKTFEAIELLLEKLNRAGAVLHIWVWGDEQRRMTPVRWGLNGKVDRRLQRYIAARLGPLPGWSMCYGFDLQEWVDEKDLRLWHEYMHSQMGWRHLLGGRAPDLEQIYDGLDYSSYQQHRPDYWTYVKAMEQYSDKPTFLEDRFRVRKGVYADKDYTFEMTRRGLWHCTIAGGAANIWGNLLNPRDDGMSHRYPNKNQIKTWSRFWKGRFDIGLVRDMNLSDGYCLKMQDNGVPCRMVICYKEDTSRITMDLSEMKGSLKAVAVDTKKPYKEIKLTDLQPQKAQSFKAPYLSDWAIVISN